ncbi:hypothetical protein JW859_06490 [bacterium]|nr:hypothetical protein [bacterium]
MLRWLLLILPILAMPCSCSNGAAVSRTAVQPAGALASLPPPPAQTPRDAQALTPLVLEGADTFQTGGMAMADGTALLLPANPGQLSYAIYEFATGAFAFDRINLDLADITKAEHLWFGIANYSHLPRCWDWVQGSPGLSYLDTPSTVNRNADGYAYLVVAAFDDTLVRINNLWLTLDLPDVTITRLANGNSDGLLCDIACVGSKPVVAFQQANGMSTFDLRLAIASTEVPTAPSDWVLADLYLGYPGASQLRLIEANNVPGLAVVFDGFQVWYAFGDSAAPQDAGHWTWSSPATALNGECLDLALVQNSPALVYIGQDANGGEQVVYARSNIPEPTGTPDWDKFVMGEAWSPAQQYSFARLASLEGDQPALTFYDNETNLLTYVYSPNALPLSSAELTVVTADTELYMGQPSAIFQFFGAPGLVYHAYGDDLYFARCLIKTPAGPEDFINRHVVARGATFPELEAVPIPDGIGVAFREHASGAVKFAWTQGGTVDSSAEWKVFTVDDRATEGNIRLELLDDGSAAIIYRTIVDDSLNYAHVPLPSA